MLVRIERKEKVRDVCADHNDRDKYRKQCRRYADCGAVIRNIAGITSAMTARRSVEPALCCGAR
jgi:hypothetical protein